MKPIIWSVKELAEITKRRVENKYDANIAVSGLTGKGKCQPKGSKVLMANGKWKNVEDIKLGDLILSPQKDGSHIFATVLSVTKWFSKENYGVYNINKKLLYKCSSNHLIPIVKNGFKNIEAKNVEKGISIKISKSDFRKRRIILEFINISLKKLKPEMVYGFELNSPSKLYITDNWMVTHNSTFLFKLFNKFPDFKIDDKFTTQRRKMINLIKNHTFSYCWNDEMISAGSKRTFFDKEQNELIQVLTKYRNHFNVVGGAVPFFFFFDKELLKLFGMHIHIISRGIGVVHLPREEGRMYTEDIWDTAVNKKLEEKWSKRLQKDPNFRIPHHKYTTFAGYVHFGPMTDKQEKYYVELKAEERGDNDLDNGEDDHIQETFYEKTLRLIKDGKFDENGLLQVCLFNDKKLSNVKVRINQMLKDEGEGRTLGDFLKAKKKNSDTNRLHNNTNTIKLSDIDL